MKRLLNMDYIQFSICLQSAFVLYRHKAAMGRTKSPQPRFSRKEQSGANFSLWKSLFSSSCRSYYAIIARIVSLRIFSKYRRKYWKKPTILCNYNWEWEIDKWSLVFSDTVRWAPYKQICFFTRNCRQLLRNLRWLRTFFAGVRLNLLPYLQ